jgi:hypothetical protein
MPNSYDKPLTAQQFYDSIKDKDSYYWKTSGRHTYAVMLDWEKNKKKKK